VRPCATEFAINVCAITALRFVSKAMRAEHLDWKVAGF
jgi:hypothetical protein